MSSQLGKSEERLREKQSVIQGVQDCSQEGEKGIWEEMGGEGGRRGGEMQRRWKGGCTYVYHVNLSLL